MFSLSYLYNGNADDFRDIDEHDRLAEENPLHF